VPFDGTPLSDDARTLLAARTLLERYGWCQNQFRVDTARCTATAIIHAVSVPRDTLTMTQMRRPRAKHATPMLADIARAFDDIQRLGNLFTAANNLRTVGHWHRTVVNWNDAPGRTREEVLAAFALAAAATK
jgi:hypothetical protein